MLQPIPWPKYVLNFVMNVKCQSSHGAQCAVLGVAENINGQYSVNTSKSRTSIQKRKYRITTKMAGRSLGKAPYQSSPGHNLRKNKTKNKTADATNRK